MSEKTFNRKNTPMPRVHFGRSTLHLLPVILLFIGGCMPPAFLIKPVSDPGRLEEIRVEGRRMGAGKIALIEVEGLLINARIGGILQPQENKLSLFTEQLEKAASDRSVKAVVLRVNSPGGTVACSDTMYEQIIDFRERTGKPVIAAGQEVMASGAYYLATACDEIYAQPTTLVGSIGVIFSSFTVDGAMAKIGVRSEVVKSGPLKDMGSPFRSWNTAEREVMQGMIDEYYERFVEVVQSKCKIDDAENLKIATDGRIFSGTQAMKLKLIDKAGSLDDAIERAREIARANNARVVMYKRPYGYQGSIYATNNTPLPQANTIQIPLPESIAFLPKGFYYLWEP